MKLMQPSLLALLLLLLPTSQLLAGANEDVAIAYLTDCSGYSDWYAYCEWGAICIVL